MMHRSKLRDRLKRKSGFTLIEILVVLVIIGILAAIAAPSLLGFIEHGKQTNRMNIARTIYLAAQNQLTELRVTKTLKAAQVAGNTTETPPVTPGFLGEYYKKANGIYEEITDNLEADSVYELLGDMPEDENPDNKYYVHYISKPKGSYPDNAVVKLLDLVIVDKSVLNEAILIEYNIKTGVVLSAFYGDALENGESFVYDDTVDKKLNIKGTRLYTDAADRKQGYYGVGETGAINGFVPATINVWDSNNKPLPDFTSEENINVLYADIKIPKDKISEPFSLLINGIEVETAVNLEARTASASSLSSALTRYAFTSIDGKTALVYRCDDIDDLAHFIWILDYVGGDMVTGNVKHSIGEKYAVKASLDGKSNLRVGIDGSVSATSYTEAHPYFSTETPVSYGRGEYTVLTARHLYNIRYLLDGKFTQRKNKNKEYIDLDPITNFAPIEGKDGDGNSTPFTGKYTGTGFSVSNLKIEITGKDNVGLFAVISRRSGNDPSVLGLTLENPSVKGRNNVGSVCGTLNGFISSVYVRCFTDSNSVISGNANVGGIIGENGNTGMLSDSVFISPTDIKHIAGADGATVGGIAGNNISGGKLQRILFLALAPKGSDEKIRPIIGGGNAAANSKLYYLSGEVVRPSEIPAGSGSVTYNTETDNGVGTGVGTDDLYFEYQTLLNGDWQRANDSLTKEDTWALDNEIYPYPYSKASQTKIAVYPDWPIVKGGGIITINHIAYYEKYDNNTYGLWFAENGMDNDGSLKTDADNRIITEAGYAILLDKEMSGTHHFFASNTIKDDEGWESTDKIAELDFVKDPAFIQAAKDAGKTAFTNEAWVFKLPLDELYDIGKQRKPLQIMYTMNGNGDNPKQISGFLQPLFAKGLYSFDDDSDSTALPDPDTFYVRTPWQMRNISALTAKVTGANNDTSGKTFAQEINLNFDLNNIGAGVNAEKDGIAYSDSTISVVSGAFKGTYTGKSISNVVILANGERHGLFAHNDGVIQGIALKKSKIKGGTQYIGGIAGINAGTIERCLVSETEVGGAGSVGAIAGLNQNGATISSTSVEYSTVAGTQPVGGVAGDNAGMVKNIYFLSTADLEDIPISGNGGGIVGNNSGTVIHALYLAPSPNKAISNDETEIYPIVRTGAPAYSSPEEKSTCFYLSGYRYSLDEGKNWENEKRYNLIKSEDTENPQEIKLIGGGKGLVTKFIDIDWLSYAYKTDFDSWNTPSGGYQYPVIKNMHVPNKWPEADSPARPDQKDTNRWTEVLSTSDRALAPNFVNGNFNDAFLRNVPLSPEVDNITVPPYQHITNHWFSLDMDAVNGWYTRPVNYRYFNENDPNYYFPSANAGEDFRAPFTSSSVPRRKLIELQDPNGSNDFMRTNYLGLSKARNAITATNSVRNSEYRYAELNAEAPGTLYQVLPSTPGAQFMYSFYHATNGYVGTWESWYTAPDAQGDRMNFYLTGFAGDDSTYVVSSAAQATVRDNALTLIRPCQSPRSAPTGSIADNSANAGVTSTNNVVLNPSAWNTVAYGLSNQATPTTGVASGGPFDLSYHRGRSYLQPDGKTVEQAIPPGAVRLYDVWIGSTSTSTGNGGTRAGYGITFWSSSNRPLNTNGYASLANLTAVAAEAATNTIGYWGVSYGWKHYYGEYTVPQGQEMTEFAFQSRSGPSRLNVGNYLDGIDFKSQAFLSINKTIKDADGAEVKFVKPGDPLTVELNIKNWGEIAADKIVIKDRLDPFDEYIEYVGGVKVSKGSASSTYSAASETLTITLANTQQNNVRLAKDEELKVTFNIKVREKVKENNLTETLLYHFRNQAVIDYCGDSVANYYKLDAYKDRVGQNASGPEPVQVFIDPVKLTKDVTPPVDAVDKPFTVTLEVNNTMAEGNGIKTDGLITDLIPKGFELVSDEIDCEINDGISKKVSVRRTDIADGTRITIWDVGLDENIQRIAYTYELEYVGGGYGVAYIGLNADYKYIYTDEYTVDPLSVQLKFPQPVVGITIKTTPDSFTANGTDTLLFDITGNDDFRKRLADDDYDVTPEIVLTDIDGEQAGTVVDGNYTIDNDDYKAVLVRGTNMLEFTLKPGKTGPYELYYQIKLTATKPGGNTFNLSSAPTKITITVT